MYYSMILIWCYYQCSLTELNFSYLLNGQKKFNFVALSVQSKPRETLIDYGETVALLPISERVR